MFIVTIRLKQSNWFACCDKLRFKHLLFILNSLIRWKLRILGRFEQGEHILLSTWMTSNWSITPSIGEKQIIFSKRLNTWSLIYFNCIRWKQAFICLAISVCGQTVISYAWRYLFEWDTFAYCKHACIDIFANVSIRVSLRLDRYKIDTSIYRPSPSV